MRYGFKGFPAGQTVGLRATERVGGVNGTLSPVETNTWPSEADPSVQAHVIVQTEVINPSVLPITATYSEIANGVKLTGDGSGFEPMVFRHRFAPISAGANTYSLSQSDATKSDSWREGLFDGAEVLVCRMVSGNMTNVRLGTVSKHRASGWVSVMTSASQVSTATTFRYKFDTWNKPSASQWFAVATVNSAGDVSAKSTAVTYTTPATITSQTSPTNTLGTKTPSGTTAGTAPTGLAAAAVGDGSIVELTWNAVSGAAGYIVYMSDYNPANHLGYGLDLVNDGGTACLAGDMVIVSKKIYAPSRLTMLTNRVYDVYDEYKFLMQPMLHRGGTDTKLFPDEVSGATWQLIAHDATPAIAEAGETFCRITLSGGGTARIGLYNHASAEQAFYPVLDPAKTYRFSISMKAGANRTVTFNPDLRTANGSLQALTFPLNVTTSWQTFTVTFSPAAKWASGAGTAFMRIDLSGDGTIDIDNFRVYEDGTPYLEMLPKWLTRISQSGISALRSHQLVKTRQRSYDLEQYTNPGGVTSATGDTRGQTLVSVLKECKAAGVKPWIQGEFHFKPTEWDGLAEFLFGSSGTWATKRAGQGQTGRWVDEFSEILWEPGSNESWNGLFAPWTFPSMTDSVTGTVYSAGTICGKFNRWIIQRLKASPHWTSDLDSKIKFVIGGWGITGSSFSADAAAACPEAHYITIAAYNGGWEAGAAIPVPGVGSSYRNTLTYTVQGAEPAVDFLIAGRNGLQTGSYEAGPGYLLNGLNGAVVTPTDAAGQERVMKSVSAGVATLDVFLQNIQKGMAIQNYFTLAEGEYWTSHASDERGGGTFPAWQAMSLFNVQAGGGDMLRSRVLWKPTTDLAAIINPLNSQVVYPAKPGASDIAAYAFRKGSKVIIFLISRLIPFNALDVSDPLYNASDDGKRTFWVKAPIKSATSLKLYRFDQGYDKHNVTAPTGGDTRAAVITVTETTLSVPAKPGEWVLDASMGASGGLPPASVYAYVFDGVPA